MMQQKHSFEQIELIGYASPTLKSQALNCQGFVIFTKLALFTLYIFLLCGTTEKEEEIVVLNSSILSSIQQS